MLADPALAPAVGDNPEHVEIPAEVAARFAAGLVNHLADIPGRAAPPSRSVGDIESIIRTRHERLKAEGPSYDASPATAVDDASRADLARELGRRLEPPDPSALTRPGADGQKPNCRKSSAYSSRSRLLQGRRDLDVPAADAGPVGALEPVVRPRWARRGRSAR